MTADEDCLRWDLFIAHAGPDGRLAEQLYDQLQTKARVFLDSRCLKLGDDWDKALAEAQQVSLVTVVLVSDNTDRAYYQREEIATAIAMVRKNSDAHRVVPVYVGEAGAEASVPYGLRLKHGLTLSDEFTVADAAHALVELIRTLGPRPATNTVAGAVLAPAADWVSPVTNNPWRYKLVAFDLDGTLLRGEEFVFSWERVWRALKVSSAVQNELRRAYRKKAREDPAPRVRIAAYRHWCEKAVEHFRKRGLTRARLTEIAAPLQLTSHCRETLQQLRQNGMVIGIVSGGIDTFLVDRFPDYRDYVDFVFINRLRFGENDVVCDVDATAYDFEGKADALRIMCERAGCDESETVFVGDHFNDEAVMLSAALSIAYPPHDQVADGVATMSIHENDLSTILPKIFVT